MNIYSTMQGTPNWMAPEVAKSQPSCRFSDIWSIGCCVIEMFQGKPLFYDCNNAYSVINKLCNLKENPQIPENMSECLKNFVKKCLIIDPKKRFNVYQLKRHPFLSQDYVSNIDIGNFENNSENRQLVELKGGIDKKYGRNILLEYSNDINFRTNVDSLKNFNNNENTNINDNNDNSLEDNEQVINKKKKTQTIIENIDEKIKKDVK